MRLAIYIPVVEVRPGGLGTYTREIVERLIKQADVTVFTTTPETVPPEWNVRVVSPPSPMRKLAGPARLIARMSWLNLVVPLQLKLKRFDAFFVPSHEGMVECPIPQVIIVHDLTMLVEDSAYFNPLLTRYMRHVLPVVVKRCSRVVAVSENTRRDVVKHCGVDAKAVDVVTEGYDVDLFKPADDARRKQVLERYGLNKAFMLYSGTFAPHKNTPFLADILKELVTRGVDVELAVTGRTDAGDFDATRRRLEELGVWDRVRCLGYVDRDELAPLMGGATAFVFPSKYEGFGLAPLEALASGATVLCSNRASLPEVLGSAGRLLSIDGADAVTAWADTMEAVIGRDLGEVQRDQEIAVERARTFSWDDAAAQILAIVENAT